MRILVLGHKGLLGNCVYKFLSAQKSLNISITDKRWPSAGFIELLHTEHYDFIINCIALIPQSNPNSIDMVATNLGLPVFLASLGTKMVHPSSNDLSGKNEYSLSKAGAEKILLDFPNVHIIRCSIIGLETNTNKSLLSWFLSTKERKVKGFTNQLWNGITTLEWAKLCLEILLGRIKDRLLIPYSDAVSKYELLLLFKEVFKKHVDIEATIHSVSAKTEQQNGMPRGSIKLQLLELNKFYS
jgi:dTDP-4-dehydrorhamnose reductase